MFDRSNALAEWLLAPVGCAALSLSKGASSRSETLLFPTEHCMNETLLFETLRERVGGASPVEKREQNENRVVWVGQVLP
jgi:hypothetical protein